MIDIYKTTKRKEKIKSLVTNGVIGFLGVALLILGVLLVKFVVC